MAFAAFVLEYAEPPGTLAYGLQGPPPDPDGVLPWRGFVESRGSGHAWFYTVLSEVTGKWEETYGVVTDGTPLDTLTRVAVLRNWDGATLNTSPVAGIDWQPGDGTLKAFPTPAADILELLLKDYEGTSPPPWAVDGTRWVDTTGAPTSCIWKRYDGADWIPLGTFNKTANTFSAAGDYLPLAGGTLTNPLLLPAGSAGAPALARSNNTDTGIHFPVDQVATSINGTNQLVVSASGLTVASSINVTGNVDAGGSISTVGTVNPGNDANFRLQVFGGNPIITYDSTDDHYYDRAANSFNWRIGGAAKFSISSTAVGIGSGVTLAAGAVTLSGTLTGPASVLNIDGNGLLGTRVYTIATLPSAGSNNWRIAMASDAGTSMHLCYSDTSSWNSAAKTIVS